MKILLLAVLPLAFTSSSFGQNGSPPVQEPPPQLAKVKVKPADCAIENQGKQAAMEPATWLGVIATPPSPQLAGHLGLKPGFGLFVSDVVAESPAHKASLKANDLLLRMDDQELVNFEQLAALVRSKNTGDKAIFTVLRMGKEEKVDVVFGKRDMPRAMSEMNYKPLRSEETFLRRKLRFLPVSEFLPIAADALTHAQGNTLKTSGGIAMNQRSSGNWSGGIDGGGAGLGDPTVSSAPESLLVGRTLLVADNITNSIVAQGPPSALEIISRRLDLYDVKPHSLPPDSRATQ